MSAKILAMVLLIAFIPAFASAGCHASMSDVPDEKKLSMDVNWDTSSGGSAYGTDMNGFVVPVNSKLLIKNIGIYTAHCENGENHQVKPPLRLVLKNKHTGEVQKFILPFVLLEGYWCGAREGCPSWVCNEGRLAGALDPMLAHTFKTAGDYNARIEFSRYSVVPSLSVIPEDQWTLAREFEVSVFSPLVAIYGSRTKTLPIKFGSESSATITWTIHNMSGIDFKIKDINYPSCSINGLDCNSTPKPQGKILPAGEFFIITQVIKLKNPPVGYSPRDINMQMFLDYTDTKGKMQFSKQSEPSLLKVKEIGEQKFSVKLKGSKDDICYGLENGVLKSGITGESAAPKILPFVWEWQEILADSCDRNANPFGNYSYCDSVQFSTELLKKLKRFDEIMQLPGTPEASYADELLHLKNFSSYLIKDGYSADLQSDLTAYLRTVPLATPGISWFSGEGDNNGFEKLYSSTKFRIYLAENSSLLASAAWLNNPAVPSSSALQAPGLYEIRIDINYYDRSTRSFMHSGQPNADINIFMIKKSPPARDSVFYYLPIDGQIGLNNATRLYERNGYGVKFATSAGTAELKIAGTDSPPAVGGTALNSLNVSDITGDEFAYLNKVDRGSVLKVALQPAGNSFSLMRSSSYATPLLMKIKQGAIGANGLQPSNEAGAFYYVRKFTSPTDTAGTIISAESNLSYWTAVSTDMRSSAGVCMDFAARVLFINLPDSKKSAIAGSVCNPAGGSSAENLYGLSWPSLSSESDSNYIFVQSVLYTKQQSVHKIYNGCDDKEFQIYTPSGEIRNSGLTELPLDFDSGVDLQTLKSVFEAIKTRDFCIGSSAAVDDIWWNEKKLFSRLYCNPMLQGNSEFQQGLCISAQCSA